MNPSDELDKQRAETSALLERAYLEASASRFDDGTDHIDRLLVAAANAVGALLAIELRESLPLAVATRVREYRETLLIEVLDVAATREALP